MSEYIKEFFKADEEKVEKLMKEYPITIPVSKVAELLGMSIKTVHSAIENGKMGGVGWRTPGATNRGYSISTASFFRWYLQYHI